MLAPLLLMAIGYTAFYIWTLSIRVKAEINSSKIRAIRIRQNTNQRPMLNESASYLHEYEWVRAVYLARIWYLGNFISRHLNLQPTVFEAYRKRIAYTNKP